MENTCLGPDTENMFSAEYGNTCLGQNTPNKIIITSTKWAKEKVFLGEKYNLSISARDFPSFKFIFTF